MTEPSLSELYAKLASLRARVERLRPGENNQEPLAPTNGVIIRKGTVFYCRPSKLTEFIERLGGKRNIEIMDTSETSGFARGKHKDAKLWTNEVYPTDIGPSCANIDSDTARVKTTPTNNNIYPTVWEPGRLFTQSFDRPNWSFNSMTLTFKRYMLIHREPWSETFFNKLYLPHSLNSWAAMKDPSSTGMNSWPAYSFVSTEKSYIFTCSNQPNYPTWYGNDRVQVLHFPSFDEMVSNRNMEVGGLPGVSIRPRIFPDDRVCMCNYWGATDATRIETSTMNQLLPTKIPLFRVFSNSIENSTPTPVLQYGGYDRKNPPGSGPTPHWGRTNLIQIKTRRDVIVPIITSETS